MGSLAAELLDHTDEIVQRWYDTWKRTKPPHPEISEAALKDMLPDQLRIIGQLLRDGIDTEEPEDIWKVHDRLDPEKRVEQEVPIEELVQEYEVAVDTVRNWISERNIEVAFKEYSYFSSAMFELAAEAVRRYARHQAATVRRDRAHYLAGVMHQLRTPLSALSLAIEQIGGRQQAPEPTVLTRLERNVRRLRSLVDGILRLERFDASEVPIRPEEVEVAQLVDEILGEHADVAQRKALRLDARLDRTLRMTADRSLVHDALGNLVDNGVKFTSEGFVIVEVHASGDEVRFRVRDSGPGIDTATQERIFKETLPGRQGGAGIGLQIASHAAQALGGSIDVESKVGKGSAFTLRVPRTVQPRGTEEIDRRDV